MPFSITSDYLPRSVIEQLPDLKMISQTGRNTGHLDLAACKEHNIIDSLLFDAVKGGYTEPDPTTTNWENSKKLLGDGTIATMMLGYWSIVPMQGIAPQPIKTPLEEHWIKVDRTWYYVPDNRLKATPVTPAEGQPASVEDASKHPV